MISASEATTALTSALKAFNLAADDAIKVVDKLTKVDAQAAVSAGGIATALQKSSTSAKLAGMSMDELIGSVSVIGEVTQQSMDTVGNAMKSILARYGNVKASVFTQMGLNDDGETTDNINDIEKVLSKLGIKVRSSSLEMRDITSVLDDVNAKWSTFDTVTKNAIATAFGGTRMRENFLVLMENWTRVKELTDEAAKSAGTADEKYEAYMDSMEAYTKRIQNAWEEISQSFEGSALIKTGAKVLTFFVENLQTLTPLIITLAATKFSDPIWGFLENTAKGAPSVFKNLLGISANKAKAVTYDENGNPIVGAATKGKDGLLLKANQQITSAVNTQGQKTNNTLTQILSTIKMLTNRNIRFDSNGKITNELTLNGGKTTVEYRKDKKTGQYGYFYTGNNHRVTKSSDIQKLEAQRQAIDAYNSQLGTSAKTGQISSYSNIGWWSGKARKMTIDGMEYTLSRDGTWINQAGEAMSSEQQAQANLINARLGDAKISQRVKTGAITGVAAALGALSISKIVGTQSGGLGGLLSKGILGNNNTQSVEETGTDKAIRVGLSSGLAAVGSVFGPIGSMIGQTIGEAGSSIISTLIHRSELEMKQRVADAKEVDKDLGSILDSVDNLTTSVGKIQTYEDYQSAVKEVEAIKKSIDDAGDGTANILYSEIGKYAQGLGYSDSNALFDALLTNDLTPEEKKRIQNDISAIISTKKADNYEKTLEEERDKVSQGTKFSKKIFLYGTSSNLYATNKFRNFIQGAKDQGYLNDWKIDSWDLDVSRFYFNGNTNQEKAANIQRFIEYLEKNQKALGYTKITDALIRQLNKDLKVYNTASESEERRYKERADAALRRSGLLFEGKTNLSELGLEGAIQEVAAEMSKVGINVYGEDGKLLDVYRNQIKSVIMANEDLYNSFSTSQVRYKDVTKNYDALDKRLQKIGLTFDQVKEAASKGEDVFSNYAKALGVTDRELRRLINTADKEQMKNIWYALGFSSEEEFNKYKRQIEGLEDITLGITTLSSDQLKEKRTIGLDAIEALTGKTGWNQEALTTKNTLLSDDFWKNFLTEEDLESPQKAIERMGEIIYGKNGLTSVFTFLSQHSIFDEIMSNTSYMDKFKEYLKNTQPELYELVKDFTKMDEVIGLIASDAKNGKSLEEVFEAFVGDIQVDQYSEVVEQTMSLVSKLNQTEINNLTEQKEALSSVNDERQKELELIKAKEALENAKKEKKRVYRAGIGFVMESDEEAISTAQENLDKLNIEKQQDLLQKQIDELEYQNKLIEELPDKKDIDDMKYLLDAMGINIKDSSATTVMLAAMYNNPNQAASGAEYLQTMARQKALEFLESDYGSYGGKEGGGSKAKDYEAMAKAFGATDEQIAEVKQKGNYVYNKNPHASGTLSFSGGQTLINELGTEAVITPQGTVTALPSKTGIVPADVTKNLWALGDVAPTLIARLSSLNQGIPVGNVGNTTYEEGQYFDHFVMNVYPAKGDDFSKILEQARAQAKLTRHNN